MICLRLVDYEIGSRHGKHLKFHPIGITGSHLG